MLRVAIDGLIRRPQLALIAAWRRGAFAGHRTVLFWHTGGVPALFA